MSSTVFYFSFSVPHVFKKMTTSPVMTFNINHLLNFAFAPWDVKNKSISKPGKHGDIFPDQTGQPLLE